MVVGKREKWGWRCRQSLLLSKNDCMSEYVIKWVKPRLRKFCPVSSSFPLFIKRASRQGVKASLCFDASPEVSRLEDPKGRWLKGK